MYIKVMIETILTAFLLLFAEKPLPQTFATELFLLTNTERENSLKWDNCLASQAEKRAREMVEKGYFSHQDPSTGEHIWKDYVAECGFKTAGENLARDYDSPSKAHEAFMDSPLHEKNILNPKFKKAGYGCYENICVQFFKG